MSTLTGRKVSIVAACALIVLLLVLVAGPVQAVVPWAFTQYASPTTMSLTGGFALDATHAWISGGVPGGSPGGVVLFNNGSGWVEQTLPAVVPAGPFISSVAAADATHIWGVGDNLDIFFSDGSAGGNWQSISAPGVNDSFSGAYAVKAPDNKYHAWAVGVDSAGTSSIIYKYTDPTGWAPETTTGMTDSLKNVSGCDENNVWAVGYSGSDGHIYRRISGTWTLVHTLVGTRLRGVKAVSPTNVWVVGNSGTILHYDGNVGNTWTAHSQSGVVTPNELDMVNGTGAGNLWASGASNTIVNFDGSTWTLFASPDATATHRNVIVPSTDIVWTSGTSGKIFSGTRTFISSCNPAWGAQAQTLDVNILGVGSNFLDGTSVASFSGTGITVNSTSVTDATHAKANITIAAGAAPGPRDVTVTTGTSKPTKAGAFMVKAMHTITPNAGAHGTITPAGPVKVVDGEDQAFTITPAAGYHTADVAVDGVHMGVVTDYAFENVTSNHTITATFSDQYSTWYLAEGSTAWGFGAAINIQNPNDQDLNANVTYMLKDGTTKVLPVGLPKMSKVAVSPSDTIGNADFSTKVECVQGKTIAVDRTMGWQSGQGNASGTTNSIGVTGPSTAWYLPEGSSNWSFETWLLIQNPNDVEASCDVTYMIEGIGPKTVNHVVAAHSRATYKMMDEIGAADASIKVNSNIGVIPERSMYTAWPAGSGITNRREGHDSIGALKPANDFFLAEGTTAWGFTTYVLVQNPNPTPANVTLTFMTNGGPIADAPFTMPANSRKTVRVNDKHAGMDLSTKVHADKPIVAERSMFWTTPDIAGQATHDSIGTSSAHMTWFLPDGSVGPDDGGYETFTLVQNPNSTPVQVRISYLNEGGKDNVVFTDTVAANARKTYNMGDKYPGTLGASASIMVESLTAGKKVIVERSMYNNGRWGGSDTIGGYTD